jgi:hypothetical protein
MAKPVALTADDLTPLNKPRPKASSRPRGETSSAEYIPLQFRLPPDFVRRFKQVALDRDMKLNELLIYCFDEFMKNSKQSS